jgi:hypothetical protein
VDPELLRVATQMIVMWPLTFLIVWLDEQRLSETMLERAWLPATRGAAVLWFSPFCLLVGVALGVAAILLVFVVYFGVVVVAGYALGVDAFAET